MRHFILLLAAFALVLLNAFFVAAEFAMVKLRHTRLEAIKKDYGFRGKILSTVHRHLDAYLSACQLGITLASLGLGWIGEPALAHLLEPIFVIVGVKSPETIKISSFLVGFSLLSFLHIVIGELVPKSLAIRQSEKISIWTATPLYIFYWIMYPAIWLLNTCANFLLRITRLDVAHHGEYFYSTEEIRLILSSSHLHGELTTEETSILKSALDFTELTVTDVMRPIDEIIVLEIHDSIEKNLQIIRDNQYSRYPVYDNQIDQIIGIVHVKDLFERLCKKQEIKSLRPFLRKVIKVSQQVLAIDLLQQFRKGTSHFALIYSLHHNLIGFVTFDNLIQILLGHIQDEFHKTRTDLSIARDGSILIKGNCSIYTLEKAINQEIQIDYEEDIETLLGLIIAKKDRLPKPGEKIEFKEFDVTIEKMSGAKILRARIFPKKI